MTRVKIQLPEGKSLFDCRVVLQVKDMNYGGHMGNEVVLQLAHEARVGFLEAYGYSELNIEGAGTIIADVQIQYLSEGFRGNEITISVFAAKTSRVGFDIFYKMENLTTGRPLALAKTGIVCFDYSKKALLPVPPAFETLISA